MLCYTLLVLGLAGQTLAESLREPYQPKLARMSTRNILGLQRRVIEGYAPMEQLCREGDTCAEACGKGFKQCASKDDLTHCFNPLKKQTCCPGGTGDACDNGYFCSADEKGETWCCPDGLSLKECAQKYHIPGPLTSQAPHISTTSATTSATTAKTTTKTKATKTSPAEASNTSEISASTGKSAITSTKSKKPESTESTTTLKTVHHESTSKSKPKETTTATPSSSTTTLLIDVSSALVSTEAAATQTTALDSAPSSTPSSTPSTPPASTSTGIIGTNGSGSLGPVSGLVFFIAGALAALV
ncbi:hypothetical protein F4801DRAFT_104244 [Xylaria longipes]|nr:hypothetical protein F4801DRAFT_104244 [Xylaria longipes]